METIFKVVARAIHPLANFWLRKVKGIPLIDNRYICIVDRENKVLAALVASRINRPGYYVPVFLFPRVGAPAREGNLEKEDNYISQIIGHETRTLINNSIAWMHGYEHVILVGLSDDQKSFLSDEYHGVIEIHGESEIEKIPGLDQRPELRCRKEEILRGLHAAGIQKKKLVLDDTAPAVSIAEKKKSGCIVGEDTENAESVIAANYAIAFGANFVAVKNLRDREEEEIQRLIQDWHEHSNEAKLKDVLIRAEERIGGINFREKKFATFFTEGLPYSLYLKNIIPCSYVNIGLRPDLFVMNGLSREHMRPFGSVVVFSPEFFVGEEETDKVLEFFKQNNYMVRPLIGPSATVRNLDFHTQHFPYDLLHICSHGGEVDGYAVAEEFTDRKGVKHKVEYDEVVGFSPVPGKGLIEVHRKTIFRKFDGFAWMSEELRAQGYERYVFEDMRKEMYQNEKLHKAAKRQHQNRIPTSCAIKCADSIHQGMFRVLASHSSPIIFNNTCWSWFEVAKFFLAGGARGYIGTLWAIGNAEAVRGAETFYANLKRKTILEAFYRCLKSISNTPSADIYIYWGLHFSTLKMPRSHATSRRRVLRELLRSLFLWFKKIQTTKSDEVKRNSIEVAKSLCDEIIRSFKPDEVESINPRARELLSEIAKRQSVRVKTRNFEDTASIDHPSETRSRADIGR
jgi:hypothetical protein